MSLPTLTPGLIVRYDHHPSLVLTTFRRDARPEDFAVYLKIAQHPIDQQAIELPDDIKQKAGLDGSRQWVICSTYTIDAWATDLKQIPNRPGVFHYGHLPPSMFRAVKESFLSHIKRE